MHKKRNYMNKTKKVLDFYAKSGMILFRHPKMPCQSKDR